MQGRWLLLARVAWVTVALLTVAVFILSIPSEFARLQSPCTDTVSCGWLIRLTPSHVRELGVLGFPVDFFAAYLVTLEAAFTVVPIVVGAIIFWRRPDDRMAFLVPLVLLMYWAGITYPYHLRPHRGTAETFRLALRPAVNACGRGIDAGHRRHVQPAATPYPAFR